jgi:4-amino-4-deoxy-L-arabinose transferase-like glycosyltransferase
MRQGGSLDLPFVIAVGFALLWTTPKAVWRPYIVPDATEVYHATRSLVDHGTYQIDVGGVHHPPRYSYGYSAFFLAPVYGLTGRPELMFAVPMICGITNMALVYLLTKRLYGPGAGVIAALFVPGLPSYYLSSWDLLSHVPSLTLFLLMALLAPSAAAPGGPGLRAALAIGGLGGVALTMRPTSVLFLLPPIALLIARHGLRAAVPWLHGGALLAGVAPFALALLWSNLQTFGDWTRTGYSYWCAAIYDLPGQSFRYDLATLREGLRYFAIPMPLEPDVWRISGLPFLLLVAAAGLIIVGLARAWRGSPSPAARDFAVFTLTTLVVLLGLYLPYTFRFYWFAYPAYVCLLPFLAEGLRSFWLGLDTGPYADRRRALGLMIVLLLCVVQRAYFPPSAADPRLAVGRQLRKLRQVLPVDAVLITNRDPLSAGEELERGRGARRVVIPLDRGTEYAWTATTPRPPRARTAEAIAAASKPVFPRVFEDDPAAFLHQYAGRRIFLETTRSGTYGGPLPPEFALVPIETGAIVALYEIKPRLR